GAPKAVRRGAVPRGAGAPDDAAAIPAVARVGIPVAGVTDPPGAPMRTVSVRLSPEDTEALLRGAPTAYRTAANDVLLAALAWALSRWTGRSTVSIDLEGHGREDVLDGADLSRTVGWFTPMYPVTLDLGARPTRGTSGSGGINGSGGAHGSSGSGGINGSGGAHGSSGSGGINGVSGADGSSGSDGADGSSGSGGEDRAGGADGGGGGAHGGG